MINKYLLNKGCPSAVSIAFSIGSDGSMFLYVIRLEINSRDSM